jgi:uncharacterized Zn finger protein (UPF0148 family)
MQVHALPGHYGKSVEIDLCGPCHLVWFDSIEQARLSGPGLLELIGSMAQAQSLPHHTLGGGIGCLRCGRATRVVHNQTRWGRSQQLECPQRDGAWQTFGQFLGERGLLRPMSSADRARALARDGALHCVSCGGALGQADITCPWCSAAPALVDVARLARALDPEGATQDHAVHRSGATATTLSCAACGAPQGADAGWSCPQCGATLTATGLAEAHRQVQAIGPALKAHTSRPSADVVRQRLQAQSSGLDRQRAYAAAMQAEADARRQASWGTAEDGPSVEAPRWLRRAWPWVVAAAAAGWWW